jgi:chromosome segregation ATPase
MRIKDEQGHFTFLSKVIAMISGTVTLLLVLGGAAFTIDERHTSTVEADSHLDQMTIEVAGQFKAIDDSRQLDNLNNALIQTQIRMDILEDRLWREQQKGNPSQEYINKLKGDLRKLEKRYDQINEQLLGLQ